MAGQYKFYQLKNIDQMSLSQERKQSYADSLISQNQTNQGDQGIQNKENSLYHWGIRIGSFALLAITIGLVYYFGQSNTEISGKFQLYTTPPGLFFIIWAFIYTGMAVVNAINLYQNVWSLRVHILLSGVNILMIIWAVTFDVGTSAAVYASSFILMAMSPVTLKAWDEMRPSGAYTWFIYLARNVYAFFLGWIIAAGNLAIGIILVYWIGLDKQVQMIVFWVLAPLCAIAGTIWNYSKEGKQGIKSCWALWLSVIWAFVGAGINSHQCISGVGTRC